MSASSNAQWVDPDVVVFVREGVLMGQRVDVEAARPIGEPFSIAERVEYFFTTSRAMFSASRTGSVAYHAGEDIGQLVWADRNGNEVGNDWQPCRLSTHSARLSRDDTQLLTARRRAGLGTLRHLAAWTSSAGPDEQLTSNRGSEVTPCLDRR